MREYKIIRTELGWVLSRKKSMGRLMLLQYFNGHGLRGPNKGAARVFYSQGSAESALIVLRRKGETPTTSTKKSESEEKEEKTSWSEL